MALCLDEASFEFNKQIVRFHEVRLIPRRRSSNEQRENLKTKHAEGLNNSGWKDQQQPDFSDRRKSCYIVGQKHWGKSIESA